MRSPAPWTVSDGVLVVSKAQGSGNIETKRMFRNYQLHIEWKIPEDVTGTDQGRGIGAAELSVGGSCERGLTRVDVLSRIKEVRNRHGFSVARRSPAVGGPGPLRLGASRERE